MTIAVDFDKTIAEYNRDFGTPISELKPIPKMVKKIQKWLNRGHKVIILTARVADDLDGSIAKKIQAWCDLNIGQILPVTNQKTSDMDMIVDDKAVPIKANKGKIGLSKKSKKFFKE